MLGSQPNCPSGSTMATNQEHLGRTPQQAPLQAPCAGRPAAQEGQHRNTSEGASLHQHLVLFMASSSSHSWLKTAQVL